MKNLFIIAPHFPPSALPPAQRVRLLVRHCKENGVIPYIFTVNHKYREELSDEWMVELTGSDYVLFETKCFNPKYTRKIGIGDLGLRMAPFLFFKLIKKSIQLKPDFILYPVPPWYILVIAPFVKFFTGIKYGIDFIDPWVHEDENSNNKFKYRVSQWIARQLEGFVIRNASIIFSVSEGINSNIVKRHPSLSNIPMYALPYGAEPDDFINFKITPNEKITIRYIGAIWGDCYPVLDGIMPALAQLNQEIPINLEFYGTSYAGANLAKQQLQPWFQKNQMDSFAQEQALRVTYKEAVNLTMTSDLLFLIGGMQPYYAASKLMGLIVSKKPFLAFVHENSFPAHFLKNIGYKYIITYSSEKNNLPIEKTQEVKTTLKRLIQDINEFEPVNTDHPLVSQHTANGMAQSFLQNIKKTLNDENIF